MKNKKKAKKVPNVYAVKIVGGKLMSFADNTKPMTWEELDSLEKSQPDLKKKLDELLLQWQYPTRFWAFAKDSGIPLEAIPFSWLDHKNAGRAVLEHARENLIYLSYEKHDLLLGEGYHALFVDSIRRRRANRNSIMLSVELGKDAWVVTPDGKKLQVTDYLPIEGCWRYRSANESWYLGEESIPARTMGFVPYISVQGKLMDIDAQTRITHGPQARKTVVVALPEGWTYEIEK